MSNQPTIFAVQDETGTVAQVTLQTVPSPSPALLAPIKPGDLGVYVGLPDNGTDLTEAPTTQSCPFTVGNVLDNGFQFSVMTTNANLADWPASGEITWVTGGNEGEVSTVVQIDPANAYIDISYFTLYMTSRGLTVPTAMAADNFALQQAIVQATDYLDQRYRYAGIKLLQAYGSGVADDSVIFLESWLTPYALNSLSYLAPTTSTQTTEWPRQGVTDYSGNTINGIPKQIKEACAQLAWRVCNGVQLQPDYDSGVVAAGAVVSQVSKEIGPLKTSISYDTKLGLGFFASFPQIDRMLSRAGLLSSGGGRTAIR